MSRHRKFTPFLLYLLLFFLLAACNDLENAGNVNQPERPPEGAFGVSETFSGPYLGVDNPVADPADAPILEVEPGGTFYARAVYESLVGITDITVSLVNVTPEGLAGPLDPTQSFFTLGAPTSISEPGGGCELTGEDAEVTCIYEVQVAEDAVNVSELEGAEGEFAYTFTSEATNAAGVTSDEDLRAYVRIVDGGAEEPEPKPEPQPETCTNPVNIPDEIAEEFIREALDKPEGELTCEDLANLVEFEVFDGNLEFIPLESIEGLQYAVNLETFFVMDGAQSLELDLLVGLPKLTSVGFGPYDIDDEDLETLARIETLTRLYLRTGEDFRGIDPEDIGSEVSDISPLANLTNLEVLGLEWFQELSDISPLAELTELRELTINRTDIRDLSPLQNLTNLERLELSDNEISDLGGLENLTSLQYLNLTSNQITSASPLQNLTNLERLELSFNDIDDLSGLEDLTSLQYLDLTSNQVTDLSPLVDNRGLGEGDEIELRFNSFSTCPGTEAREAIQHAHRARRRG